MPGRHAYREQPSPSEVAYHRALGDERRARNTLRPRTGLVQVAPFTPQKRDRASEIAGRPSHEEKS